MVKHTMLKRNTPTGKLLLSLLLWLVAAAVTSLYILYENDPYDPLRGTASFRSGTEVGYSLIRSRVTGRELPVAVRTDEAVEGYVLFRRLSSTDEWQRAEMKRQAVRIGSHGGGESEELLAAMLPALNKMGGKYAFRIVLTLDEETLQIDGGDGEPVVARFRGSIPAWILIPHIVFIMLSLLFGLRASLAALLRESPGTGLMWTTIATLLLGGFVFGPLVQLYAFGVLWSGIPFGWDLTDNKVLFELLLWLFAVYCNTGPRKGGAWSRRSIILAGAGTFLIYLIPHSLFGSAYDYTTGSGTGTGPQ